MYRENATELVVEYIAEGIRSGRWPEGGRIETEDTIGSTLGVSRVAVRQGIDKLSTLGVLSKLQGSGTYVCHRSVSSLTGLTYYPCDDEVTLQILEFRQIFDSNNTRLFIRKAREEDYRALEDYMQRTPSDDVSEDSDFHGIIANGTHNLAVIKVAQELADIFKYFHAPKFDNETETWHRSIYEAVLAGDEELAYLYSVRHTQKSIDYIIKRIEERNSND